MITRTNFNGIDISGEQSQTYRSDGAISTLTLNAGHELFGGQWMVGGEYVDQRPVSDSARGYSAVPLTLADANGDKVFNGSSGFPEGIFGVPSGNALGLAEGIYTRVSGSVGTHRGQLSARAGRGFFTTTPLTIIYKHPTNAAAHGCSVLSPSHPMCRCM